MVHRAARTNVNPLLEAKQKSPVFGGREFARLSFSVVGGRKVYFSHFLGGFILSCWRCLLWSSLEHKLLLLCRQASCPTLLHWWNKNGTFFQIQKPKSRSKFLRRKGQGKVKCKKGPTQSMNDIFWPFCYFMHFTPTPARISCLVLKMLSL